MTTKEIKVRRLTVLNMRLGSVDRLANDKEVADLMEQYTIEEVENLLAVNETPSILHLHERYYDPKINKEILKVSSGYIYYEYDSELDKSHSGVFVPH